MSLSDLSIRRPVFAWMLMSALIIFGGLAFTRLGVSQLPDVDFPVVNISVSLPGAAPAVIENQLVDIIEDSVMGIEGIVSVNSTSRQNSANVSVEFEIGKDIDIAVQEVGTRIAQVRSMLPANLDPPTIRKTNPEDQPILWLVLTSDVKMPLSQQMMFARDQLFDQFSTLDGVGDIALGGFVEPNLRVWLSGPKLAEYELTVSDVINSIKANHQEVPAGRIEDDKREMNIRLMGEANDPEEFAKIPIISRGGRPNYRNPPLKAVARIEEGLAEIRRIARFNGKPAVGLGILKQHGSNAINVVKQVREKVKQIQPTLPTGLELEVRNDSTRFIRDSVNELNFVLVMSAILTSIVCYVFLGSWSSTFNVLMAIPTSIIGAFLVLYFFHFTLNTFTLLALSLAIGIVVDDAIMMLENIMRHFDLGLPRREAAIVGANEITFAAVAATAAVVAIFLPAVFMKGVIGRYFYQYGITVTAAVLLSLLEALTLTPMRSSQFMQKGERRPRLIRWVDPALDGLKNLYAKILIRCLNHRALVLTSAALLFISSLYLFKVVPGEMVPTQDQSQFMLRMKCPMGSSIEFTDKKAREVEEYLAGVKEIDGYYTTVGGFGGDAVNEAQIFVTLVQPHQRKLKQSELINIVRTDLNKKMNPPKPGEGEPAGGERGRGRPAGGEPTIAKHERDAVGGVDKDPTNSDQKSVAEVATTVGNGKNPAASATPTGEGTVAEAGTGGSGRGSGGRRGGGRVRNPNGIQINAQDTSIRGLSSGRGYPVEFSVQGPEWETLGKVSLDLIERLKTTPALVDVNTDYQLNVPEIALVPDRKKAAERGVSEQSIAQTVNALVGGAVMGSQTRYLKNGHRYDIRARLEPDERLEESDLKKLLVRNNRGEVIPLTSVVKVEQKPSLQMVTRHNRERSIRVYSNLAPGHSQNEAIAIVKKVAAEALPSGYHIRVTGSSQSYQESMQSLLFAFILGIIVSYMVLASQFNSFIHPATILMALPFSISGAMFALFITNQTINMFSMIGLILLMGIVKKNSILLVEFTNHLRSKGVKPREAIIEACPVRLRPILMTSVATVAGAIPEALSIGPGAETLIPMAIAIIGGVIASTLLTLIVVPCVYSALVPLERTPDPASKLVHA